jgi:hypothetical protein
MSKTVRSWSDIVNLCVGWLGKPADLDEIVEHQTDLNASLARGK